MTGNWLSCHITKICIRSDKWTYEWNVNRSKNHLAIVREFQGETFQKEEQSNWNEARKVEDSCRQWVSTTFKEKWIRITPINL